MGDTSGAGLFLKALWLQARLLGLGIQSRRQLYF